MKLAFIAFIYCVDIIMQSLGKSCTRATYFRWSSTSGVITSRRFENSNRAFVMSLSTESRASDVSFLSTHKFSVAPMMEYTDRYQRFFMRLLSKHAVLYTEMVVANALVRSQYRTQFLEADFDVENPVVLQLGGADPIIMAEAAKLAFSYGYKEINVNCGCPSEKVAGNGCFGNILYDREMS